MKRARFHWYAPIIGSVSLASLAVSLFSHGETLNAVTACALILVMLTNPYVSFMAGRYAEKWERIRADAKARREAFDRQFRKLP